MKYGHFSSVKYYDGLMELKWKSRLRIYLVRTEKIVLVSLGGGTKNGQDKDIK